MLSSNLKLSPFCWKKVFRQNFILVNIDFRELLLRGLKGNSWKNMRQLLGSSF